MDTSLTRRAFAVFEDALDLDDASDREAWLISACGADRTLAEEVRKLLLADAVAERAMPTGGLQLDAGPIPQRIGHYRIVDRLGQGGMGDVFIGARDDGLFDHAVAIKRVRPSLLPETAHALFDRERRALAALNHRHIAQLYDGGVDEAGAPYFIMELVRGVPIDTYVLEHDLTPGQIVEKMISVCEAVQHAHQNLIVHADLKPANILVNDAGDPKVVDFGVARLLRGEQDSKLHPQTPGYASPQREAGASPTPADDVFALGAILRALLTGEAPRRAKSARLTSDAVERSAAFSSRAKEWRRQRVRAVQGDLDEIIERACAAAPEDRHPAAIALAADLRAWLDVRPIAAHADDRVHAFRKFLRRRRWRVIGGAVAAVTLVVALMLTSTLYAQADFARRQAEARFTEVRSLAKYLLYDVYDRLERTPQTLAMRRDVARVAQGYLTELADGPSAPADVLFEAADGLVRIADIQAGRSRANLGELDGALENLRRAEEITARLAQNQPSSPSLLDLRARIAMHHAALAMNSNQDIPAATRLLEEAGGFITRLPVDSRRSRLLSVEHEMESAILGNWKGAYKESAKHARRGIEIATALPPDASDAREAHYLLTRTYDALGEAVYYGDSEAASEVPYQQLVDLASAYTKEHPDDMLGMRTTIEARWALGVTLLGVNKLRAGLSQLEAAADMVPTLLRYQPDDEGARRTQHIVLSAKAQALAMNGRFEEGVALLQEQVNISEGILRKNGPLPSFVRSHGVTLAMLADLYADNSMGGKACPLYARALTLFGDLERQQQLTQLDRDSSIRMIRERQDALKCG